MRSLNVLLAMFLAVSLLPLGAAQDDDQPFSTFSFDELAITFFPKGLGGTSSEDVGSGLRFEVRGLKVSGLDAIEFRWCIDDPQASNSLCPYPIVGNFHKTHNGNQQVEANEVTSFRNAMLLGLQSGTLQNEIERLERLDNLLKSNITVDGGIAQGFMRYVDLKIIGAEGARSSNATFTLDATLEARYKNDKAASRHEIRFRDMELTDEGFVYSRISIKADGQGDPWSLNAGASSAGVKSRILGGVYTAEQSAFEAATKSTAVFVAEKTTAAKKKRSPGFETLGVIAALAVVALVATSTLKRGR